MRDPYWDDFLKHSHGLERDAHVARPPPPLLYDPYFTGSGGHAPRFNGDLDAFLWHVPPEAPPHGPQSPIYRPERTFDPPSTSHGPGEPSP